LHRTIILQNFCISRCFIVIVLEGEKATEHGKIMWDIELALNL